MPYVQGQVAGATMMGATEGESLAVAVVTLALCVVFNSASARKIRPFSYAAKPIEEEMDLYIQLDIEPLQKSAATLREALDIYEKDTENSIVRDSVIKRFEYTYETSIKTLKRYLSQTSIGIEGRTDSAIVRLQDLVREAYAQGVLSGDWAVWHEYSDMRNRTAHTYDESTALLVVASAAKFLHEVDFFCEKLYIQAMNALKPPPIQINLENWNIVEKILHAHFPRSKVWAFGSRAKGSAGKFSDLDLLVDMGGRIPSLLFAELRDEFSESFLPWTVDIIDIHACNPDFLDRVKKDLVLIWNPMESDEKEKERQQQRRLCRGIAIHATTLRFPRQE